MKLTNEQIKAILDGAPEGWTHYCTRNRQYFRRDGNSDRLFVWIVGTESWSAPLDNRTRWLERRERLEEILELRQEVERLKSQQSEVAARAIEEAVMNTPTHRMKVDGRLYHSQRALVDYANQLREQSDE